MVITSLTYGSVVGTTTVAKGKFVLVLAIAAVVFAVADVCFGFLNR